ncbi:MAG: MarR family transcriptional regulator [Candidatus Micrarchaeia archaeon]|jgi:predicted nucleotidyltransferase
MEQLYQKTNILRVLSFFFENPYSEVHLREIGRRSGMSPSTLSRLLGALQKAGLVVARRERNASFFKASLTPLFKAQKTAYNVSRLFGAGVVDEIKNASSGLSAVLLYGSAAKGEDDENSDYDLLVIASSCNASAQGLSRKLGREASLKKFTISEWKRQSKTNRAFYLDVISNSTALLGEKPVID